MSELNIYHHELRPDEYDEFYLKSEGDKVIVEKESIKSKIAYRLRAVLAVIRGKEIDFVFSQIEKWFKGELFSQKISSAVYGSDVFVELIQEYDKKLTEQTKEAK